MSSWWDFKPLEQLAADLGNGFSLDNLQSHDSAESIGNSVQKHSNGAGSEPLSVAIIDEEISVTDKKLESESGSTFGVQSSSKELNLHDNIDSDLSNQQMVSSIDETRKTVIEASIEEIVTVESSVDTESKQKDTTLSCDFEWEKEKQQLEAALQVARLESKSDSMKYQAAQEELAQCRMQLHELQTRALAWKSEREELEMQLLSSAKIQIECVDRNVSTPSTPQAFETPFSKRELGKQNSIDAESIDREVSTEKVMQTGLKPEQGGCDRELALQAQVLALQQQLQETLDSLSIQHATSLANLAAEKADAESQIEQISTKLRDLAKVYSECKNKLKKAQSDLEASAASNKALEDEVAAVQVKFNDVRKHSMMASESQAEEKRYAEGVMNEQKQCIETLRSQVLDLENRLKLEKTILTETMTESNAVQIQEVKAQSDKALKDYIKKLHTMEVEHASALSKAQEESLVLSQKLKSYDEAISAHDDYKKRAQLALKKANSVASERALELEAMQKELEEVRTAAAAASKALDMHSHQDENDKVALAKVQALLSEEQARYEASEKEKSLLAKELLSVQEQHLRALEEVAQIRATSLSSASALAATPPAQTSTTDCAAVETTRVMTCADTPVLQDADTLDLVATPVFKIKAQTSSSADVTVEQSTVNTDANLWAHNDSPSSSNNAGGLFYTQSLKAEIETLRSQFSVRGVELEDLRRALQSEKAARVKLSAQREELICFIDRNKQASGEASGVNMEYLKNCIIRYMSTIELSEKKRLFPVIATILKLTTAERADIESGFQKQERYALADGLSGTLSNTILKVRGFWEKS